MFLVMSTILAHPNLSEDCLFIKKPSLLVMVFLLVINNNITPTS